MEIKRMMITGPNNFGRNKKSRDGVVIHWTGNLNRWAGVMAHFNYANRKGFRGPDGRLYQNSSMKRRFVFGAANFYVDDSMIGYFIDVNKYAPHVGAPWKKMTALSKRLFGKSSPNYHLDGIEICVNSDNNIPKTIENGAWLAGKLLREQGNSVDKLYRHFDITGKNCPAFTISPSIWNYYKQSCPFEYREFEIIRRQVEFYYLNPDIEPLDTSKGETSVISSLNNNDEIRRLQLLSWGIYHRTGRWDTIEQKEMEKRAEALKLQSHTPNKPLNENRISILNVQKRMNHLGFTDYNNKMLVEDNSFGKKTRTALNKFQKTMGIRIKSSWDNNEEKAYKEITSRPYVSINSQTKKFAVRFIQYKIGAVVDGAFGPNTKSKVKSYQRKCRLIPVDGQVGSKTWRKLLA